eukprot:TRINITY_DN7128_c1_g4_i1.p1 TRINITY_DN7128_c1_g4~~TRINITY_DN7128_c1_g4_i1.p1  ORF type:complete len:459 (-),score=100.26 TRINITY_DN7128_c1_g4_i1:9-1385(-)
MYRDGDDEKYKREETSVSNADSDSSEYSGSLHSIYLGSEVTSNQLPRHAVPKYPQRAFVPPKLNSTMRAVVYSSYGSTSSLRLTRKFPTPNVDSIPSGCVLVKVLASSVNPLDWKILHGYFSLFHSTLSFSTPFPFIPGFDISGVVIYAGPNCKKFSIGDAVYGMTPSMCCGAWTEFAVMSEANLAYKPFNLTFAQAASLPLVSLSAYQGMLVYGGLGEENIENVNTTNSTKNNNNRNKKKVLILGGSGGVGSIAVQIAKIKGCYVVATCSKDNVNYVKKRLGADKVIDYGKHDWWELLGGDGFEDDSQRFDLVFDTVGGEENWKNSWRILKPAKLGGNFVTLVGDKVEPYRVSVLLERGSSFLSRKYGEMMNWNPIYNSLVTVSKGHQLERIKEWIEGGKLKPCVNKVYTLDDIVEAVEESMKGRVVGKLVIVIDRADEEEDRSAEADEKKDKEEKI